MNLRTIRCLSVFLLFVMGVLAMAQQQVAVSTPEKKDAPPPQQTSHKIGPLDFAVSWRTRTEGWDFFKGASGNGNYTFGGSLLRVSLGQRTEHVDWFVEGEQVGLIDLPNKAVVAAPQGQLGLGANYYAANSNETNAVGGFLKQGFVAFNLDELRSKLALICSLLSLRFGFGRTRCLRLR